MFVDALRTNASERESMQRVKVGGGGFEPIAETPGNIADSLLSGANSGALPSDSNTSEVLNTPADPDLAEVVTAWPELPQALRAGIVAMVKAARATRC